MRLTKLEIHGFKSFARKTELLFDDGITAVIGPNGSGKSNIADAVRWVLGEQSARALRGLKMEDVIFNGTQERRPQSYCEVTLTFDNADGTLPLDFNEVSVTRRVYRSGESEYAINRNNCRLKDITELFRDTGVGKEGYSIISQGRVDEILSNKSNDRRTAIEEAAGIMRYRARKEEAVRKLDNTKKNLERLQDILTELDNQREPLREQAEKAQSYLKLRDELKDLEINVFLHQYEKTRERIENAKAAIAAIEEECAVYTDTEKALSTDCAQQEEELRAIEQHASELQNTLLNEMSLMDNHTGEVKVLLERRENLEKEMTRLKETIQLDEQKKQALQEKLVSLKDNDDTSHSLLLKLDEQIADKEQEVRNLNAAILEQETLLEEQKNSIIEHLNRLSDAKSQLSRMEAMTSALTARQETVKEEETAIGLERDGLLSEQAQAQKDWDEKAAAFNGLLSQQKEQMRTLDATKLSLQQSEKKLRDSETGLNAMRSRANVLEEMARAHEGYYASVRNLLKDCDRDISLRRCVLGVVAELITVPKQYEIALEMTLGSALQNIVTPTPEHAKQVIEHLRNNKYGRATLLPVSDMRGRTLNEAERAALRMPGCIGVASELIGYDQQYQNVMEYLLGRTVIVEDLDAGIAINRKTHAAFRIATIKGDIINPGGSMTGGSVQKREFSLLGRERELKELREDMQKIAAAIKEQEREIERIQEAVRACKAALVITDQALHDVELENTRHKEKLELIIRDLNLNQEKLDKNRLENTQIEDNLLDILKEREAIERLQSGIEEGNAATQEDVQHSQSRLTALRGQAEAEAALLTERKVERMALQKEEDAIAQEKKRIAREIEQAQKDVETAKAATLENEKQSAAVQTQIASLSGNIEKEQALVDTHREQQQNLNEEKQKKTEALNQARARKDELNLNLRSLDERKHKQELNLSRAEVEFSAMQERILTDYTMTYEDALPLKKQPFAITGAHVRIDELRGMIRELGNINVNAVEDFLVLEERYEGLTTQCEDLHRAQLDLDTLIGELTSTMEQQFLEQFKLIQENFSTVFCQLFNGGQAELRLQDAKDPLNCEIDIIAQPPGKKLQLLSLLSGGERALTAIALLFAMLKLKPTVFCILDEIETALDEMNVTRFANYLKHYSADTQFILITHRKGSMEVCNTLYGVAMQEKGVSRVVSAKFH
ncbi:chromosome segregation protein SMC [Christensenellaceae bacterium OttesenSCG-928-M15]|nr:chromosome segregation protein SMC [Christensenellaceae bacterium OttesenSCG-928-M15]